MLKNMHLVGEDENDDLYADFEQEYNPAFDTEVKFVFSQFVCTICVGFPIETKMSRNFWMKDLDAILLQ